MRILAIETSGRGGSVALAEGDRPLDEARLPGPQRTAKMLAPRVAASLQAVGWQPRDVQLVAVSQGPGSFTGLRIGMTTAKTLAWAVDARLLGVSTLEVLACQAPPDAARVACALDAYRGQLFAARFARRGDGSLDCLAPAALVEAEAWIERTQAGDCLIGPALARMAGRVPAAARLAEPASWEPRAATVAQLAWRDFQSGRRDDPFALHPAYLRPSAAEELRG